MDASASFDPDGQIVEYRWDFGDGSTGEGETVSHVYDASGEYTVTLSVTDDRRGSDEATLKLQIGPPLFELKVSIEPEIGGEVILDPPGGKYEAGTPVMLAAEAAEGFFSPAMRATKEARMPN